MVMTVRAVCCGKLEQAEEAWRMMGSEAQTVSLRWVPCSVLHEALLGCSGSLHAGHDGRPGGPEVAVEAVGGHCGYRDCLGHVYHGDRLYHVLNGCSDRRL